MTEAVISRLQHIYLAALARDDVNLARECAQELLRYGISMPPAPDFFEVEHAVPAAPLETATRRIRQRPRQKGI